jgi:Coenzyme PQQ synthesis protein D (PqqD)
MPLEVLQKLRGRVPGHVVYRDFQEETVVLNLDTGQYHGLNATARRMLPPVLEAESIALAADALEGELGVSRSRIERDLGDLCGALVAPGLLEFDEAQAA